MQITRVYRQQIVNIQRNHFKDNNPYPLDLKVAVSLLYKLSYIGEAAPPSQTPLFMLNIDDRQYDHLT